MQTSTSAPPTLDGKYALEEVIGHGGMGLVLGAFHTQLRQKVAIKIAPAETTDEGTRLRLLREARAAARLQSEHVCRVLDVGDHGGTPYIVMERLEGADLAEVFKALGTFTPREVAAVGVQICEGLAEAHAAGIVHRDVKPKNVFVALRRDNSCVVKVLDFGISKVAPELGGEEAALTTTSTFLGTPSYLAPEQISSPRDVDARADVWALGVCLYQMLVGRLPFAGSTVLDLAVRIASETVSPPSEVNANVPAEMDAVVLRCLQKDARDRFQRVEELRDALLSMFPTGNTDDLGRLSAEARRQEKTRAFRPLPPGTFDARARFAGSDDETTANDVAAPLVAATGKADVPPGGAPASFGRSVAERPPAASSMKTRRTIGIVAGVGALACAVAVAVHVLRVKPVSSEVTSSNTPAATASSAPIAQTAPTASAEATPPEVTVAPPNEAPPIASMRTAPAKAPPVKRKAPAKAAPRPSSSSSTTALPDVR